MLGVSFPGANGGTTSGPTIRTLGGVNFHFNREGEITEMDSRYVWEDFEKALMRAGQEKARREAAGKRPQFCLIAQPELYEEYCTKVHSTGEYGSGGPYFWEGIRVYPGVKIVAIDGNGDPISQITV